jgi:hypothetical protein
MARIDPLDVATTYAVGAIGGAAIGYLGYEALRAVGYYPELWRTIAMVDAAIIGSTSVAVFSDGLRNIMKIRKATTIEATTGGRAVPVNLARGTAHIFLSALTGKAAGQGGDPPPDLPEIPQMFVVRSCPVPGQDPADVQLDLPTVETFLHRAWDRQGSKRPPFSRRYWTQQRRPPLDAPMYYGLLTLLLAHGLIANRGERRSGRLILQPSTALRHLKYSYGLRAG